ncbi:Thiamine biosynthesis lipoprotein ApbE precursor [Ruegeria denitrificans]|uniref:FAD:protein FMN transferase n=1 Tax=Ruegeria denitrificans TaxID=1715692 RepID=A0A0N7MAW7_9RHOB|nr:FAD:protein FMN transferase [Ruegeria denitrificans]CUK17441.1 Thiamine biosynthesis lipoprotein ApbE precursor [Ruegeria denitrificans]
MTPLSRRRFLTMSAACAAFPADARPATTSHWRGIALGAPASLRLEGLTDAQAAPLIASVEAEVNRLENIFSLYRPQSELSRLNRDGHLTAPAPELLNVLSLCSALHKATGGVFDPSIQPLWSALANGAAAVDVDSARKSIGWSRVSVRTDMIRLPRPGISALTLNGIAQGAITDRIADLLTTFGLRDVLVNMGEITARGHRENGQAWQVGLAGPGRKVVKSIELSDRAVATSDPNSLMLTKDQGHILNPQDETSPNHVVSVSASSAAVADGLSTALCAMPETRVDPVVRSFAEARIEMFV